MKIIERLAGIAFMLTLLALAGCTEVNSKVGGMLKLNTDLKLQFVAGNNLNPDENHTASPVFIRLYELSSDKAFAKADFLDLYENDEATLGKDLIAKQELSRLLPGETRSENFVMDKETRYVAMFAEFFQYKNSRFKVIFPVTANNIIKDRVLIEINDNQMRQVEP